MAAQSWSSAPAPRVGTIVHARDVTAPVLSARAHWPVARAAELLVRYGFTALPVVDEQEQLLGLVTEGDVLVDRRAPAMAGGAPWPM